MQRKVLGMLLVVSATILLVGIGADFASYTATRSAKIAVVADNQELINLEPGQPYAYIASDGKLYIDISSTNPNWVEGMATGISPDSKYDIDKVFYVSNDLWAGDSTDLITVTVTSDNPTYIKLYSTLDLAHHDSASSAGTITFDIAKGAKGDVGLHLIGPSITPAPGTTPPSGGFTWTPLTADIKVVAVKK